MSDDLYQETILDHYHHPDNFGKIDHPDHVIEETNASCGDSFTFYVKISPNFLPRSEPANSRKLSGGENHKTLGSPGVNDVIEDLKFEGTGCAISTAACSMLTTYLKGKPLGELANLTPEFMQNLIGAAVTPLRLKCLLLPARALSKLHY